MAHTIQSTIHTLCRFSLSLSLSLLRSLVPVVVVFRIWSVRLGGAQCQVRIPGQLTVLLSMRSAALTYSHR